MFGFAKCFGAEALKDFLDAQLEAAENGVRAAEAGKNRFIADKFNKGIEGLQQAATTDVCD